MCFHSTDSKCNTASRLFWLWWLLRWWNRPIEGRLVVVEAGMGNQPGNLHSYPGRCMAGIRLLLKPRCTQLQHALTGSGGEGWGWEGFGRPGGDPRVKTPPVCQPGLGPVYWPNAKHTQIAPPVAGIVMHHMMGRACVRGVQWVVCWRDDLVSPPRYYSIICNWTKAIQTVP